MSIMFSETWLISKNTTVVELIAAGSVVTFATLCVSARVARSPVFYGRSRILDPFSRLPGGKPPGRTSFPYFLSQIVAKILSMLDPYKWAT